MTREGDNSSARLNTVVTADLVGSTAGAHRQEEIAARLHEIFGQLQKFLDPGTVLLPFKVSRGDSFQGVLAGTRDSLLTVLYLRCAIRQSLDLDVRQAIGIGETQEIVGQSTLTSSGEAFLRSGRLLNSMSGRRNAVAMAVVSGDGVFDAEFNTSLTLFDALVRRWTVKECEAVFLKLHNWSQTEIADYLGIHQSAVHKRLRGADYYTVEVLLSRWHKAVTNMFESVGG